MKAGLNSIRRAIGIMVFAKDFSVLFYKKWIEKSGILADA